MLGQQGTWHPRQLELQSRRPLRGDRGQKMTRWSPLLSESSVAWVPSIEWGNHGGLGCRQPWGLRHRSHMCHPKPFGCSSDHTSGSPIFLATVSCSMYGYIYFSWATWSSSLVYVHIQLIPYNFQWFVTEFISFHKLSKYLSDARLLMNDAIAWPLAVNWPFMKMCVLKTILCQIIWKVSILKCFLKYSSLQIYSRIPRKYQNKVGTRHKN